MKQISSYDYKGIYKRLGIDMTKLYAVMLDVEYEDDLPSLDKEDMYEDEKFSWVDGYVAKNDGMHCTLLYGLLDGVTKDDVEEVLEGWKPPKLEIEEISKFDGAEGKPYNCVIGKLKISDELTEGHQRLSLLPHINTYLQYKPHITMAYVKDTPYSLYRTIDALEQLEGKKLKVSKITFDNNSGYKKVINI